LGGSGAILRSGESIEERDEFSFHYLPTTPTELDNRNKKLADMASRLGLDKAIENAIKAMNGPKFRGEKPSYRMKRNDEYDDTLATPRPIWDPVARVIINGILQPTLDLRFTPPDAPKAAKSKRAVTTASSDGKETREGEKLPTPEALSITATAHATRNPIPRPENAGEIITPALRQRAMARFDIVSAYDKTLGEAQELCRKHMGRLPDISTNETRELLHAFLHATHLGWTFTDVTYNRRDGYNRVRSGQIVSDAIPTAKREEETRCFYQWLPSVKPAYSHHGCYTPRPMFTTMDDRSQAVYLMDPEGKIISFQQPVRYGGTTQANIEHDFWMSPEDVRKLVHLVKVPVICEKPAPAATDAEAQTTESRNSNRTQQAMHDAIQLCYDTVERLEVSGVNAQKNLGETWERFNIAVDASNTRRAAPGLEGERSKRGIGLALTAGGAFVKIVRRMMKARKFARSLNVLNPRALFSKVRPSSRKSNTLLSAMSMGKTQLPLLLSAAGLGYSVWRNYGTQKQLAEQARDIETTRERLAAQAKTLETLHLSVDENAADILRLQTEMTEVRRLIGEARTAIELLTAVAAIHTAVTQVTQATSLLGHQEEARLREVSDLLIQVDARRVPALIIPVLRENVHHLGLHGKQMVQHPDEPVRITQIIRNGQLDIFAHFLVGEAAWELYEIIPLPRFSNGKAYVRTAAFSHALVGKSQKQYIPLDAVAADNCRKGTCDATGVIHRVRDDACTVKMLSLEQPAATCPFTEIEPVSYVNAMPEGVVYSVPSLTKGRLNCPDDDGATGRSGPKREVAFQGIGLITVPPGCSLSIANPELTIVGPPLTINIGRTALRLHKQGASIIRQAKNGTIMTMQATRKFAKQFPKHQRSLRKTLIITVAVLSVLAIILVCITGKAVWVCKRLRHVNRKAKERYHILADKVTAQAKQQQVSFGSAVTQARSVMDFLQNRDALKHYVEGAIPLGVKRHISTMDLSAAGREGGRKTIPLLRSPSMRAPSRAAAEEEDSDSESDFSSIVRPARARVTYATPLSRIEAARTGPPAASADTSETGEGARSPPPPATAPPLPPPTPGPSPTPRQVPRQEAGGQGAVAPPPPPMPLLSPSSSISAARATGSSTSSPPPSDRTHRGRQRPYVPPRAFPLGGNLASELADRVAERLRRHRAAPDDDDGSMTAREDTRAPAAYGYEPDPRV
jgi:hypothetical protein